MFPDDTNPLPTAGSAEQAALLDDEHDIGDEGYLDRLNQMSGVTDDVYPELVAAARNALAAAVGDRPVRVLDLCCGIGVITLKLVEAGLPIEQVTLADLSDEMLRRARAILGKRLGDRLPPLDAVQVDLLVGDVRDRLAGGYDLVITHNAFQHFPRERQATLFAQLRDLLAPSGVFVFGSHFKLIRPRWKQHLVEVYSEGLRRAGAPPAVIQNAADHVNRFHNYVNLRDAYEWFEAAGFGFYECVYRRDEMGILVGVR